MNKRTFIHKTLELLEIGKEIVKQSDDEKYTLKVTLVNLMLERKMKAEEISELSDITGRTLSKWVKYETTIRSIRDFLKTNPAQENCKYYLIMDNAPWHKKPRG